MPLGKEYELLHIAVDTRRRDPRLVRRAAAAARPGERSFSVQLGQRHETA